MQFLPVNICYWCSNLFLTLNISKYFRKIFQIKVLQKCFNCIQFVMSELKDMTKKTKNYLSYVSNVLGWNIMYRH
jgi:hypothetical protein